jgi:hypothetical protein
MSNPSNPEEDWLNVGDESSAADTVRAFLISVKHVRTPDGRIEAFDADRLAASILRACATLGTDDLEHASRIAGNALTRLTETYNGHLVPTVDEIAATVADTLREHGAHAAAETYTSLRLHANDLHTPSMSSSIHDDFAKPTTATTATQTNAPRRRRLNDERKAVTHKFQIGTHEGYLTVGLYDDTRQPGEIFLRMSKEGSMMSGLVDAFATAISIGLQYGVPLKVFASKFAHMRFEPSGPTQNPNIPNAKSVVDYVFRYLAQKFLTPEERQTVSIPEDGPEIHPNIEPRYVDRQPRLVDPTVGE